MEELEIKPLRAGGTSIQNEVCLSPFPIHHTCRDSSRRSSSAKEDGAAVFFMIISTRIPSEKIEVSGCCCSAA